MGALEAFADYGIDVQRPATPFFYAVFSSLNFLCRTLHRRAAPYLHQRKHGSNLIFVPERNVSYKSLDRVLPKQIQANHHKLFRSHSLWLRAGYYRSQAMADTLPS